MKSEQQTLHFAFGPVQGFVSQARRTRDLWAGSYLLSWLAGHAMSALLNKGGEIKMPDVKGDALLQQICHPQEIDLDHPASHLGSLPNRFTALVPDGVDGTVCTEAIHKNWQRVTDAVFSLVSDKLGPVGNDIWKRQTGKFWECTWVIGEAGYLLNHRKNFRIHFPQPEPGEKCTVCGEREELSDQRRRPEMNTWWEKLSESISEIHGLDLRDNERLCAVCLTKRLFPRVAGQAIGWKVPEFYPSTLYMSAVDWIIHVLELAKNDVGVKNEDDLGVYPAAVQLLKTVEAQDRDGFVKYGEKRAWYRIAGIKELVESCPELEKLKTIQYVDGAVFYQDALRQKDLKLSKSARPEVLNALEKLQKVVCKHPKTKHTPATASPFYALLLMDGDNMGKLVGNRPDKERGRISLALSEFTRKIPEIVREHNGMLLYAGGDDVFALLPVSTALECARLCRVAYQCSFKEHAPFIQDADGTISAAVQYVQMNTALGVVVRDAHVLLDTVAKDGTGRDALACRVWKRGGPILTWTQPWTEIDNGSLVESVLDAFTDETTGFSSKFFYKLPRLFELINAGHKENTKNEESRKAKQDVQQPLSDNDMQDLLIAEYLADREHDWTDPAQPDKELPQTEILAIARKRLEQLLGLCRERSRNVTGEGTPEITNGGYSNAGALLVRFLAQKEV